MLGLDLVVDPLDQKLSPQILSPQILNRPFHPILPIIHLVHHEYVKKSITPERMKNI